MSSNYTLPSVKRKKYIYWKVDLLNSQIRVVDEIKMLDWMEEQIIKI